MLRLEMEAWSMVKLLRQATNEFAPALRPAVFSYRAVALAGGRVRSFVRGGEPYPRAREMAISRTW